MVLPFGVRVGVCARPTVARAQCTLVVRRSELEFRARRRFTCAPRSLSAEAARARSAGWLRVSLGEISLSLFLSLTRSLAARWPVAGAN